MTTRPLYLRDIGHFHLLCGTCRRCGELNVHGFYHQVKAAGQVEIVRERKRSWHRWACHRCGQKHATAYRLTTSPRQPRLRLFRWLEWAHGVLNLATDMPWAWPLLRHVGLYLAKMESVLPL